MQLENVRRPLVELRDQVLRLRDTWTNEGRHFGAIALRASAQTLTQTAQHLDGLAARLDVDGLTAVAPTSTADAFPPAEIDPQAH